MFCNFLVKCNNYFCFVFKNVPNHATLSIILSIARQPMKSLHEYQRPHRRRCRVQLTHVREPSRPGKTRLFSHGNSACSSSSNSSKIIWYQTTCSSTLCFVKKNLHHCDHQIIIVVIDIQKLQPITQKVLKIIFKILSRYLLIIVSHSCKTRDIILHVILLELCPLLTQYFCKNSLT